MKREMLFAIGFALFLRFGLFGQDLKGTVLLGHTDEVFAVAFSPDGKMLARGSSDQTVRVGDPAAGKELAVLKGHKESVRCVAFHPDGKVIASGGWDTLILWDVASRKARDPLQGRTNDIEALAFSSDGKLLVSGGEDKIV